MLNGQPISSPSPFGACPYHRMEGDVDHGPTHDAPHTVLTAAHAASAREIRIFTDALTTPLPYDVFRNFRSKVRRRQGGREPV